MGFSSLLSTTLCAATAGVVEIDWHHAGPRLRGGLEVRVGVFDAFSRAIEMGLPVGPQSGQTELVQHLAKRSKGGLETGEMGGKALGCPYPTQALAEFAPLVSGGGNIRQVAHISPPPCLSQHQKAGELTDQPAQAIVNRPGRNRVAADRFVEP